MTGTAFGRYRLQRPLAQGATGEVWSAYDTDTDQTVALKLLPTQLGADPVFADRFARESHTAAQLRDPHVIPIHDHGQIEGRLYLATPLLEGTNLDALLARDGPPPPPRAVTIIAQVGAALDAAHAHRLIHRDIKPANILVGANDYTCLTGFGIARAAGQPVTTSTGTPIDTYSYMAPERLTTGQADARTDVYALTCVLHECLTGTPPYPGDSYQQQSIAHLTAPPPRPSQLRLGVPAGFDDVIARGMAKNPDDRYPSAGELAAAAHSALPPERQSTPEAPPAPAPLPASAPRRRWIPILLAVLAVALAGAGIAYWKLVDRDTTQDAGPAATSTQVQTPSQTQSTPSQTQSTLPFTGLNRPEGVAVDIAGNVYVSDNANNQVLKLAAGSNTQSQLPFTGIEKPVGVAVSSSGDVYVADASRVLKLAAGSGTQASLPFTLDYAVRFPVGVAVNTAGDVFVTRGGGAVLKVAAGSNTEIKLPLSGGDGIAVSAAGDIYVTGYFADTPVLMLAAGSAAAVALPFAGLGIRADGIAVDTAGNVYVADTANDRVLKLGAGSSTSTVLPLTGLDSPRGVAVDTAGNVYVADSKNNRVLKLAAG